MMKVVKGAIQLKPISINYFAGIQVAHHAYYTTILWFPSVHTTYCIMQFVEYMRYEFIVNLIAGEYLS